MGRRRALRDAQVNEGLRNRGPRLLAEEGTTDGGARKAHALPLVMHIPLVMHKARGRGQTPPYNQIHKSRTSVKHLIGRRLCGRPPILCLVG